jgi:hypothetical protein
LTSLNAALREHGLLVRINRPSAKTIEFIYAGEPAFLEFYSIDSLASHVLHELWLAHRDVQHLPAGGTEARLHSKGGATLYSTKEKIKWVTFTVREQTVTLRRSRDCPIDVDGWLSTVSGTERHQKTYWCWATT